MMTHLQENFWDYLIVALYVLGTLGIGVYFSREKRTSENYLLGNRSMPPLVIGIACMMSMFSSISIVAITGEVFNNGMTLLIVGTFVYPLLSIPCYLLFARFWFKLGSFTPYEYLEYRYDKNIRAAVAFSSFFLRVIYIGMVLFTSSKIFEGAFGWSAYFSILLTAVVGVACCFLGGSKAVIWTDVFQALITFGGMLTVIIIAASKVEGGIFGAIATGFADGHGVPQFSQKEFYSLVPYERVLFFLLLWNAVHVTLLDACSNQVVAQRVLSTKNWRAGFKSQIYSNTLGLAISLILYLIGFSLYAFYKTNPVDSVGSASGDIALFYFVKHYVPQPLSGLFMAAMLAAIMSTISGVVNSMAGVWLKEFHSKYINKNLTAEKEFVILRRATLILGAIGVVLAVLLEHFGRWMQQSVAEVNIILNLLCTAIVPAYLFAVLSKRANSALIWATVFFGIGDGIAWNVWYALSRSSLKAWENDPACGLNWAGKLPLAYVIIPLAAAVLLTLPVLFKHLRSKFAVKLTALLGCTAWGITAVMLIWYIFSNIYVKEVPLARSFAYVLPLPLILSGIALFFCPVQPKEKYEGLTLNSLK